MKKDKQIIIAIYGKLAEGFKSELKTIVDDSTILKTVTCNTTPESDVEITLAGILSTHSFDPDVLIISTDMLGGSVNSGFVKYLGQYPFYLITNINLLFLVDLLLTPGGIDEQILISKVNDSLVSVKYVNQLVKDLQDCDEL